MSHTSASMPLPGGDPTPETGTEFSHVYSNYSVIGSHMASFYQCGQCFAVVTAAGREGHDAWHLSGQVEVPR